MPGLLEIENIEKIKHVAMFETMMYGQTFGLPGL